MEKKSLKARKVKSFNVKLLCVVLSRSEFSHIHQYYYFVGSSTSRRKSDNAFNTRAFYRIGSYTSMECLYPDLSFEDWNNLPSFVCVEDIMHL